MGGIEFIVDWLRIVFKNKKYVIIVNKDLLVIYLKLLEDLVEENGVVFKFEVSVVGGIFIVNVINNGLNVNNIFKFMGIFNGIFNFIFLKMIYE